MILHSCVYSLEISCTTGHTDFTMTNFFYKFKGSHAKNCAGKNPTKIFFFSGNILISQMLTAAAIAIAASMVYIFAEHKTPMTNGIHNKRFQGLTLGWSQQYFSHILLTHKGLPGTTTTTTKMLLYCADLHRLPLFISLIEVAQLSI